MKDLIDLDALHPTRLEDLSALLVAGPDARVFLQGQLSADLEQLEGQRALLASCNSAQGRVQAAPWLIARSDGIALLLPSVLTDTIATRLRKYILRAKVTLSTDALSVGVVDSSALQAASALGAERSHTEVHGVSLVRLPGHRQIVVLSSSPEWSASTSESELLWRLDQIRAGLPQIYMETYEAFVAQMLNIDLLEGVSFSKGCYTGQEIIARTHYRGATKRRMFHFKASCAPPARATRLVVGGQHAGDVVDAAPTEDGCELLAVVSLAQLGNALELETRAGAVLERLPMPYLVTGDS